MHNVAYTVKMIFQRCNYNKYNWSMFYYFSLSRVSFVIQCVTCCFFVHVKFQCNLKARVPTHFPFQNSILFQTQISKPLDRFSDHI